MTDVPPYRDINFLNWPIGHGLDWHSHPEFQIIHVLAGTLVIDWGDGWRILVAGDAHVLPPLAKHRTRTDRGHSQLGLNFTFGQDPRGIIDALSEAFPAPTVVHLDSRSYPLTELRAAANGVLPGEALSQPTGARLGGSGSGLSLEKLRLYAVLDLYCLALIDAAGARRRSGLPQRMLEHLQTRIDGAVTVESVAEELDVSRATLQRTCQAAFGCGLAHLHERLRLTRAAKLLIDSDIAIAACAIGAGYPDVYQFSRAFRRVLGRPPTTYRKMHRELAI